MAALLACIPASSVTAGERKARVRETPTATTPPPHKGNANALHAVMPYPACCLSPTPEPGVQGRNAKQQQAKPGQCAVARAAEATLFIRLAGTPAGRFAAFT